MSSSETRRLLDSQGSFETAPDFSLEIGSGSDLGATSIGGVLLSAQERQCFADDPIPGDDVDLKAYVKEKLAQRQAS